MGRKKGFKDSEETKRIISEKNTGHNHTEETKRIIREKNTGLKRSEETKRKISLGVKGKYRTPESFERINNDGYILIFIGGKYILKHRYIWEQYNGQIPEGYVIHHIDEDKSNNNIENLRMMLCGDHSILHRKNKSFNNLKSRKIYQKDKKTKKIINIFDRLSDIKEYNISCISKCCNNKMKSYKGFIWSFSEI